MEADYSAAKGNLQTGAPWLTVIVDVAQDSADWPTLQVVEVEVEVNIKDLTDESNLIDDKAVLLALDLALLEVLGFEDVLPTLEVGVIISADIFVVDFNADETRDEALTEMEDFCDATIDDAFADGTDFADDLLMLEVDAARHVVVKIVRMTSIKD